MSTPGFKLHWFGLVSAVLLATFSAAGQKALAPNAAPNQSQPVPMDQLGLVAGRQ